MTSLQNYMQEVLSEDYVKKCGQAYALYVNARDLIEKDKKYAESITLLKQMYSMVGEEGLRTISQLEHLVGDKGFRPIDFFEAISWSFYQIRDFDSSIFYTNRWMRMAEEQYGNDSPEKAHSLRRLGMIYQRMNIPAQIFFEEWEKCDTVSGWFAHLVGLVRPFYWMQQSLNYSMKYFVEGYNILKRSRGADDPETKKHKEASIDFLIEEVLSTHIEQTLWIYLGLVPLLTLVLPFASGLTWKSLGIGLLVIASVAVWRICSTVFYYFMTKWHYERAIQ